MGRSQINLWNTTNASSLISSRSTLNDGCSSIRSISCGRIRSSSASLSTGELPCSDQKANRGTTATNETAGHIITLMVAFPKVFSKY